MPPTHPSNRPPASKALKSAWRRGDKNCKLSRHCWPWVVQHSVLRLMRLLFLVQQVDLSALQPRWYQLQNHCTASTVVTPAAECSPLLGSNFPILFPVSNHKVLSLERMVFFSLCYCLFGSWIFPWCFPGALHLRHNTKKWNAMCSLLIIIDWCWKECCM